MSASGTRTVIGTSAGRTEDLRRAAFRPVVALVACYAGLSVLTLAAIIVFRDDDTIVNDAAWIRGSIVAATSVLLLVFTLRASGGARRAYLRVRIVSPVLLAAVVVIVALPGTFPGWMRIEQAVCGALLIATVVLVNTRRIRSSFPTA
jgi:hypothetical protein